MITRKLNLGFLLKQGKSVFLFGPRGSGKTTLLDTLFGVDEKVLRYDLLNPGHFQRYATHPDLFLQEVRHRLSSQRQAVIVVVDEIQKLPGLLDTVHLLHVEAGGRARFVLTGSSARKLRRTGANLLAGRALTCFLHPFSSFELGTVDLGRALQFGTLPAVYLDESKLEVDTLEAYVGTYLKEEILAEALVRKVDRFTRFLEIGAQMNGEPTNFSKLGRQCGVNNKTAEEYFTILCDTLLAHRIDGWSQSAKRQLLQSPKHYLFDCGVLNAITGEVRSPPVVSTFRYGRLFETFLVQEWIRWNDSLRLGLRFNYWRTKDGREVDLVVSRSYGTPLAAVELKSQSAPDRGDLSGLEAFTAEYPRTPCYCLCTTPRPYRVGAIEVLPWQEGLQHISAQL